MCPTLLSAAYLALSAYVQDVMDDGKESMSPVGTDRVPIGATLQRRVLASAIFWLHSTVAASGIMLPLFSVIDVSPGARSSV